MISYVSMLTAVQESWHALAEMRKLRRYLSRGSPLLFYRGGFLAVGFSASINDPETIGLWPGDSVERRAVSALVPYARNARTHSPEQVAQIAASIREWGFTTPVLVDEASGIIAGHGRVLAAQKLGLATIPVMVARGWSKAQVQAYVLADNKLALNAGWDAEALKLELADLQLGGFDLGLTGFSGEELAGLLDSNVGLTDPDEAPAVEAEVVAVPGDVWLLGRHRLVCGDSTDPGAVDAALAGVRPHLMVTDPPYGVEYDAEWRKAALPGTNPGKSGGMHGKVKNDDRADWSDAWALFPGDVAYIWHGALHAATVAQSIADAGFEVRSQIIWVKHQSVIGRGHYHWQHEPCWYAIREAATGHWAGDRKQTTAWQIDKPLNSDTGHSAQKPVECMKRPIENNSSPGQAVYEPFSGSGTTIIAAEMTGRACHAIELSPAYVDVAVRRWQAFTGLEARLESNAATFGEVAADRLAGRSGVSGGSGSQDNVVNLATVTQDALGQAGNAGDVEAVTTDVDDRGGIEA
jgi:DNA modification methylase